MDAWFEPGHVAIVTGGSRGLGRALARELLARGLHVIVDGRDGAALDAARRELDGGGNLTAIRGDIAEPGHAHALIDAARRIGRLDLLINNASTLGETPLPSIASIGSDVLRTIFEVNVVAPVHLIRHALPLLRRSELATIVNVTSDAAVEAYAGWGGYGASKAALECVSRVLAAELDGSAVRVLVVDPGEMDTRMHRDAVPDADASTLRDPAAVAPSILRAVAEMHASYARVTADAGVPA
jgi:NAD(P)-dependent dehydrogenase (short-subunit alcohol dehydrogenase family)